MTVDNTIKSKTRRFLTVTSGLAIIAGIGLAFSAGVARADWHDHRDQRDGHHHGDWRGGYYAAPPVVYGGPVYAPPPVVYGPSVGIALPAIRIGIH